MAYAFIGRGAVALCEYMPAGSSAVRGAKALWGHTPTHAHHRDPTLEWSAEAAGQHGSCMRAVLSQLCDAIKGGGVSAKHRGAMGRLLVWAVGRMALCQRLRVRVL